MEEIRAKDIFSLARDEVYSYLKTSSQGLTEQEAKERLAEHGLNVIEEIKKKPLIYKFLANFVHLFAILLWVGGFLAFVGRMPQLGWAIFAVIVINAVFSFWQEYKAEKATEALKKLLPSYAKVVRGAEQKQIQASELVPGDVIILEEGDNISADARLTKEFELRTNEATLTGESEPVRKTAEAVYEENLSRTEIPNLVFAGTSVAAGSARAVIFATGMTTEFGKIAYLTQTVKQEPSPLQKEMSIVTKIVAVIATSLGLLFFGLGSLVGMPFWDRFLFAVGIIVANVPEGLLPTVTLALAMGVQRMAERNALIKRLSCVETLGSATVICTDKTGTLTQNEMTVREIWVSHQHIHLSGAGYKPKGVFHYKEKELGSEEKQAINLLMKSASFCNNARLLPPTESKPTWSILGDPTEGALLVAAAKVQFDYEEELKNSPRIYELPFDSSRKRMTTIHQDKIGPIGYMKGAPREVLDLCNHIATSEGVRPLSSEEREEIVKKNDEFAGQALRVLAMAYRTLPQNTKYTPEQVEKDLTFVGLMAMMDPPRLEVEEAVEKCGRAGIKIIMVTGDYGLTAESIARRIGMVKKEAKIITGFELERMTDEELKKVLKQDDLIFARVSPEHKLKIVSCLKEEKEVVAVTGDGVNDAPALKRADIGVAMGIVGTDVAREASAMILTDDNFASIVNAIEEGRAVYDNIRRFVTYIFASNIPELVPFILMVMFKIPLPLTVMQILAIDLGTDMVPALALGTEKAEPGVMSKPPRERTERLLNMKVLARAYLFLGPLEATVCITGFFFMFFQNGFTYSKIIAWGQKGINFYRDQILYMKATTMTHIGVISTQIGNAFAVRTSRESVFKIGLFSNRFLLWGILVEVIGIIILVNVSPFQGWFEHHFVSLTDWLFMFAWAPTLFIADEIRKFIVRKYFPLES